MIIFAVLLVAVPAISLASEGQAAEPTAAQASYDISAAEPITIRLDYLETQPETAESTEAAYIYYDVPMDKHLQEYAQDLCREYDFPYKYVVAIIDQESAFQPDAVSGTSDYGLMQINKINHEWLRETLGVTDFFDPEQNIQCGIYMIQRLYHKYGEDITAALMAYNCGETGAAELWAQGIAFTRYSSAIEEKAENLRERTD